MRFSTNQTSFDANPNTVWNQGRNNLVTAFYRGQTVNATATELFIDNISTRRMVPDRASGGVLRIQAVAYNITDNTTLYGNLFVSFQCSSAGVITLVDQDSVTGGSQDNVLGAVTTAGTRAGVLGVTVGVDNGVQVDVVAASGTPGTPGFAPAYLRLQVRGAANKTVSWEVFVEVLEATSAYN